jgi:hypothetical protein
MRSRDTSFARFARLTLALVLSAFLWSSAALAKDLPAPVREWMHNEQVLLSRALDKNRIMSPEQNDQNPDYAPENQRVFKVKTYWVDTQDAHAFSADSAEQGITTLFKRTVNGRTQVRLMVHPESESFYKEVTDRAQRAEDFEAMATSSSRTLLAWAPGKKDQPFFAKLSLNSNIGGVVRTIPLSEVSRSVGATQVFEHERGLPGSFHYLPEVVGVMPKGMERGGMIIRQIPKEVLTGQRRYVPLFSLYAKQPDGSAPMLAKMIKQSGQDADVFVRERIVGPFVKQWLQLLTEHGITSEPHAQNVLFEIGPDGLPTGNFLQRDFGGFNVDFNYRERIGLGKRPANLAFIRDFDREWHLDETARRKRNLEVYFKSGFLFNLDENIPAWHKAGYFGGKAPIAGSFQGMLKNELHAQVAAITGRRDFVDYADAMTNLQEHVVARGGAARPNAPIRGAVPAGHAFRLPAPAAHADKIAPMAPAHVQPRAAKAPAAGAARAIHPGGH